MTSKATTKVTVGFGWKAILAAGLCAVLQTACGGSSSTTTTPAPTPGVASPSPSPSPSPTATLTWVEVSEISQCPSHPLDCPTADGFNVDSSGAYSVDSLSSGGNVTAGELAQLNALGSIYAANNGLAGLSCSPTPVIPGGPGDTTVMVTYSDGSSQTILSISTSPPQTCILGSQGNASALYQLLGSLASRYNPTPGPSPAPSL